MDETRRDEQPVEAATRVASNDGAALVGFPRGPGIAGDAGPGPAVDHEDQAPPPLGPKRLHPAWILLSLFGLLRGFAIPLVIVLIGGGERGQVWFLVGGGALALLGLAAQTASWLKFRYEVTGGELRVRSGIVSRHERSVPLERIQVVDVSESVLQRLFGVVQVRIETAAGGAGRSDAVLQALGRADADILLARLAAGRRAPSPGEPAWAPTAPGATTAEAVPSEGALLYRVTFGELLVAGVTSGRVGPALALLVAAWQILEDVVGEEIYDRLAMDAPEPSVSVFVVIGLLIATVAWMLAIAGTVLTFGNFELRRAGDRLLISHGLLDRRRSTIPIRRVQAVTIHQGLLRLPFGLATVRVESAGYGQDSAVSGVLSPIIRVSAIPDLLRAACSDLAVDRDVLEGRALRRLPARARIRYVTAEVWQALAIAVGASALAALVPFLRWWWGVALFGALPVAALYGLLQFRDTGWAIDRDDRLILRTRGLARRMAIVPRRRVQHRTVTQNVLQRRAALATVQVAVASGGAGGRFGLRHVDVVAAYEIVDRLGPLPATVPASEPPQTVVAPAG